MSARETMTGSSLKRQRGNPEGEPEEGGDAKSASTVPSTITNVVEPFPKEAWDDEVAALSKKHRAEASELRSRQSREMRALKERLEAARKVVLEAAEAGCFPRDAACADCGKHVDEEWDGFAEQKKQNFEDVDACRNCAKPLCAPSPLGECTPSRCVACQKPYCRLCVRDINRCAKCYMRPALVCCNLARMPCGEYECEYDCAHDHHKRCGCQRARRW